MQCRSRQLTQVEWSKMLPWKKESVVQEACFRTVVSKWHGSYTGPYILLINSHLDETSPLQLAASPWFPFYWKHHGSQLHGVCHWPSSGFLGAAIVVTKMTWAIVSRVILITSHRHPQTIDVSRFYKYQGDLSRGRSIHPSYKPTVDTRPDHMGSILSLTSTSKLYSDAAMPFPLKAIFII